MVVLFCLLFSQLVALNDYISGEQFIKLADHRYPGVDPQRVQKGDIIYVCGDNLLVFANTIAPYIDVDYIVISHNSDENIDSRYLPLLELDHLHVIFAQNVCIDHPKLKPVPIGIANSKYLHGTFAHFDAVIPKVPQLRDKPRLLHFNFLPGTNLGVRGPIFAHFEKSSLCKKEKLQQHKKYLAIMGEYKFVLSPPGNGMDCHRTWEALYLGCIPVVQKKDNMRLLKGLPFLEVEDWSQDVTRERLERYWQFVCERNWDWKKLSMSYWKKKIQEERASLL